MNYLRRNNSKSFIIAEAGVNHNGDFTLAKRLVDVAVFAGADAVKFQTFITEENQSAVHLPKKYLKWAKSMELSFEEFGEIAHYCRKKNILFLSTPFEFKSVDFLDNAGVAAFKISSGEATNIPLLNYIAGKGKPIILSTGMTDLEELDLSVKVAKEVLRSKRKINNCLERFGCFQQYLVLLHCVSEYPTAYDHVNLYAMYELYNRFKLPVGISDHSLGIEIPIAAAALGACVIEKHFTFDKNMKGADHKISLSPQELKLMVSSIRNIERALGSGTRHISMAEKALQKIARKSIVAARVLHKGEIIKKNMIYFMRPGKGIPTSQINEVLGKCLLKDMQKDEMFSYKYLSTTNSSL